MGSCHWLLMLGCYIQHGHRIKLQRQKAANENDDLILLLCLCLWFGTYDHIKENMWKLLSRQSHFRF